MNRLFFTVIWGAVLFGGWDLYGAVKPGCLFAEEAVLQQGVVVPIWGTAKDGESVTVSFQGQSVTTIAQDGYWRVDLQPLQAGGPFLLTITGENEIRLENVLVGEVWLCSGQSNMSLPLFRSAHAKEAIAAAADAQLRFFTVPVKSAVLPRYDTQGTWKSASPKSARSFSAVAYYFGRELRRVRPVPVGLIHAATGGTPIAAWNARVTAVGDPKSRLKLARAAQAMGALGATKAMDAGSDVGRPACLYNGMIAPLEPFAIAGVIWYQGEADANQPEQYRQRFPALIANWRQAWGQGDFPFLFVQAAPWMGTTPGLREAQLLTWETVPETAMVVTMDVGDRLQVHPLQKEPVGTRLALAARAVAYGEPIEYSGPVYHALRVEDNRAILSFTHVGSGLAAKDGELRGFTIAGENGRFFRATAEIAGDSIIVSSPAVAKPVTVRYGWSNVPNGNLFNLEGLPATPFRTDAR